MVAASTTISRQTFYWVGSNQAMINAGFSQVPAGATVGYGFSGPWGYDSVFSTAFPTTATGDVYWGDKNNWMVQVRGATLTTAPNPIASSTGGYAAGASAGTDLGGITGTQRGYYWEPATRIPHRGDTVIFKYIPVDHDAGLTFTAPLSPCLFGGRGNSGGNMWIGDLAAGMTTGNANAVGELNRLILDKSYFEQDGPAGQVARWGFSSWGMGNHIPDTNADGLTWSGINVKAQFLELNGPGQTGYDGSVVPFSRIAVNDVENCGQVHFNSKFGWIYGGTCNNLHLGQFIPSGLTGFRNASNTNQFIEGGGSSTPTGIIETRCSVLNTIDITPTLLNSIMLINDPGGSCEKVIYGPYAKSAAAGVYLYTGGVQEIFRRPTEKLAGNSLIRAATGLYEITAKQIAETSNVSLSRNLARLFRNDTSINVAGWTANPPAGGLASDTRTTIGVVNYSNSEAWGDYADRNFSYNSALDKDFRGFNNGIAINSGMTIDTLYLSQGCLHISEWHQGGNTYDFDYENTAIAVSGGFIALDGHLDMRHPENPDFANFIVGDSTSTDPNRGILMLSGGRGSRIDFAPTQYAKWGPPASGQTAGASESARRGRRVTRTLSSRSGD